MSKGLQLVKFILLSIMVSFVDVCAETISLTGTWQVRLDTIQESTHEVFLSADFNKTVELPGCLHAQNIGFEVTPETKWYSGNLSALWHYHPMYKQFRQPGNIRIFDFLQPAKHFIGAGTCALAKHPVH